jgi:hypothetical protein
LVVSAVAEVGPGKYGVSICTIYCVCSVGMVRLGLGIMGEARRGDNGTRGRVMSNYPLVLSRDLYPKIVSVIVGRRDSRSSSLLLRYCYDS